MCNGFYCKICKRKSMTYHEHCAECGCEIYVGDECYEVGDKYYCVDCVCTVDIEEPERDWDYERERRNEDADF